MKCFLNNYKFFFNLNKLSILYIKITCHGLNDRENKFSSCIQFSIIFQYIYIPSPTFQDFLSQIGSIFIKLKRSFVVTGSSQFGKRQPYPIAFLINIATRTETPLSDFSGQVQIAGPAR